MRLGGNSIINVQVQHTVTIKEFSVLNSLVDNFARYKDVNDLKTVPLQYVKGEDF